MSKQQQLNYRNRVNYSKLELGNVGDGFRNMIKIDLRYLGNRILVERKKSHLSQQELANQTRISVKTLQDIEKGRKNPTYKTLARLIARLGIYADTLFPSKTSIEDEELQQFIGKFQACNRKNQKILLNTLNFLAEQLLARQIDSEDSD